MNEYYNKLCFVRKKLIEYLEQIFKVYGNELLLRLEEYNLLTNENNCLETSTAIGFIMEEFITSKLEIYSKDHNGNREIKIKKITGQSTVSLSYDCFVEYQDVFFMINIKVQKNGSNNNAVAAINALYNNYVVENQAKEKAYLVLKTYYDFDISKKDLQRKIMIKGLSAYYLEEIDFSKGHKQDHRNWSEKFNANSGRLQISDKFKNGNLLDVNNIAHPRTKMFVKEMYEKKN